MSAIVWDRLAERFFETGVNKGVLYEGDNGTYVNGVPWNGLVNVNQEPSGAESNKQYADNIVYVNLMSAEEFSATVEAFMAPREFDKYDGTYRSANGLQYGQQSRPDFAFSWQTTKGNALNEDLGYVINIAYGLKASPSSKSHATKSDSPELTTFSWSFSSTPVEVPGLKPTAIVKIDSTDPAVNPANLAALEKVLYGDANNEPRLPLPAELDAILGAGVQTSAPVAPAFDGVDEITIPNTSGVSYSINGSVVPAGPVTITEDTVVKARPAEGYTFTGVYVDAWLYEVA